MAGTDGLLGYAQGFRPQPPAVRSAALHKSSARVRISSLFPNWAAPNGGEGGIRTLGGVTPTHPFQGCTIGHSVTSPWEVVEQINRSSQVNRNRPFRPLFAQMNH
jgi:hypothetical protein